jgi:anti-sigma regulatory factor (Ser/Thr protein kinase)
MPIQAAKAPPAIDFESTYPGAADQCRRVRADLVKVAAGCPVADAVELLAHELAANAVLHSRSGLAGGTFTVRATLYPGDYAWVEVIDQGGQWAVEEGDEHGRGLEVVAAVAGDGNWGIDGDSSTRVAWFRLDWPQP